MKKKLLSLLMALVMVAGLAVVPTGTANAAANKGAVVPVSFKNNVTWQTVDWENNKVDICAWGAENVTLSANATVNYTLYLSKGMFDKAVGEKGEPHALDICCDVNVHDAGENGDWNYLGALRSTNALRFIKIDPNPYDASGYYVFTWTINGGEEVDISSWVSVEEEGDYYKLTVKDYPIGGNMLEWDEEQEKDKLIPLDMSKPYNINVNINIVPQNGVGGDAVIILDDVAVKDSGNVLYSEKFEGIEECANKWTPGDDDENWPQIKGVAYNTNILSLKAKKADIKVGKKAKIKATSVAGTKVTYKSNKPKIASVDAKGNVKGLKKGKAVISVTCCGKTLKYTVKVSK